jgi:NADP-reducing hydrogenase subunit HndD
MHTKIGCAFEQSLADTSCIMCGQCINVCPTGALTEKDHIKRVWDALADPELHVVVQTAPAVRVALGEEFGEDIGTRVTTKMTRSLKKLGFDRIFDTNTAADITIMEEGTELLNRIKNGGVLPMFTSCSPGWVKYLESYYPEFIPNLSSCKSPAHMFGALIKSWYAKKENIDPAKIYVVSVMPCTAKKFESERPEHEIDGHRDIDAVLTTRELARMIKTARINWNALCTGCKDCDSVGCGFDDPFGTSSGAGAIFGVTGGVTEAALRTVAELLTGERIDNIEYESTRGAAGIKEYKIEHGGTVLKGAVVSGTGNAKKMLERIKAGDADYQFIEFMGCPGGCITGGGQPIANPLKANMDELWAKRAASIYNVDKSLPVRRSHENPCIISLYKEIGEPGGHEAHRLFHTHFTQREQYAPSL